MIMMIIITIPRVDVRVSTRRLFSIVVTHRNLFEVVTLNYAKSGKSKKGKIKRFLHFLAFLWNILFPGHDETSILSAFYFHNVYTQAVNNNIAYSLRTT